METRVCNNWTAAFDIGTKNFAFAVRDSNKDFVIIKTTNIAPNSWSKTSLNKLTKKNLYNMVVDNHSLPVRIKKDELVTILLKQHRQCTLKNGKDDVAKSLFKTMDSYSNYWERCLTFLVERQMTVNAQALKLSHYLEAYLEIKYPDKNVVNYSSSMKTKKLGACILPNKSSRKKWTVAYALKLLKGDNLKYLENLTKKDDIADVVCMIQSFALGDKGDPKQTTGSEELETT
jgi:hypothetical protein